MSTINDLIEKIEHKFATICVTPVCISYDHHVKLCWQGDKLCRVFGFVISHLEI